MKLKMIDTECERELLGFLAEEPGMTYNEMVMKSYWSPGTIDRTLRRLRREKKVESMKGELSENMLKTKAKRWYIVNRPN